MEPLLDKNDCTTRYIDLPNKKLSDFIIAGINVAPIFEDYAESVILNGNPQMYSHYAKAISASNEYKTKKVINLGLVEMMFVFVKIRLHYSTLNDVLDNVTSSLKNTNNQDVLDNLAGFSAAISTSTNTFKKASVSENMLYFKKSQNIHELFQKFLERYPDPLSASHQVAQQYINGFPIVSRYIKEISEKKGLIKSLEDTFNTMHKENADTKIGILADLSAVAMFIYLSFKEPNYVIR